MESHTGRTTDRDGNNDIYLMDPDGTGATNPTRTLATRAIYQWSGIISLE